MQKEILTMEAKICPYLNMDCQQICPAWLEDLDDCLFHVCLTQVKDVFFQAAKYLDDKLGLPDGTGVETLKGLRQTISGNATEEDKKIARSVIKSLLSSGVLGKIQDLTVADLGSLFSNMEKVIHFDLASLFSIRAEDEEDEEGEDEGLIFAE